MNVRWLSSPESTAAGQVSVLAVVETVIASALTIWWAWSSDTLAPLLVSSIVAPLLLLRTDRTLAISIDGYRRVSDVLRPLRALPKPVTLAIVGLLAPVLFFLIKTSSALITVFTNPMKVVAAVPQNWFRVTLAQDLAHPPEVFAGIEAASSKREHAPAMSGELLFTPLIVGLWNDSKELISIRSLAPRAWLQVLRAGALWLVVALTYLPAVLYRFSVKCTAIVYLPLIWTLQSSVRPETNAFAEWIEWLQANPVEQARRWYAIVSTTLFFVVPIGLFLLLRDIWAQLIQKLMSSGEVMTVAASVFVFITPTEVQVKSWHIARLVTIALTFWLWWYVTRTIVQLRHRAIDEGHATSVLTKSLLARGLLGLFVVACNPTLLWRAVDWSEVQLPVVRFFWHP